MMIHGFHDVSRAKSEDFKSWAYPSKHPCSHVFFFFFSENGQICPNLWVDDHVPIRMTIYFVYGGYLIYRGTPSHHPFLDVDFS